MIDPPKNPSAKRKGSILPSRTILPWIFSALLYYLKIRDLTSLPGLPTSLSHCLHRSAAPFLFFPHFSPHFTSLHHLPHSPDSIPTPLLLLLLFSSAASASTIKDDTVLSKSDPVPMRNTPRAPASPFLVRWEGRGLLALVDLVCGVGEEGKGRWLR